MISGTKTKKILKEAGIKTKGISITVNGSTLRAVIKDLEISKEEVKRILKTKETIHRCQATGDILSGGNFFIQVDYDGMTIINEAKSEFWTKAIAILSRNHSGQFYRSFIADNMTNKFMVNSSVIISRDAVHCIIKEHISTKYFKANNPNIELIGP